MYFIPFHNAIPKIITSISLRVFFIMHLQSFVYVLRKKFLKVSFD
ncbi:hypothetical protein SAMN05192559_107196 [Halobacillus karajensis]|nr:hypothetical protein SAMN05192559_107196 [Halobacillus karajensis]